MAELQFNTKIKSLQTDWGGEFRPLASYLVNLGINHRLICPHTHHQNGVVERKHRHIVELGLTLLNHASLPLKFWDIAFTTAVYIINIVPTAPLDFAVPYTIFKNPPDYQFLKTFGCAYFPFLRPYNKHKLDFRSHECVSFWDTQPLTKATNVSFLLVGCSFPKMSFLMSLDFLTLSCLNPQPFLHLPHRFPLIPYLLLFLHRSSLLLLILSILLFLLKQILSLLLNQIQLLLLMINHHLRLSLNILPPCLCPLLFLLIYLHLLPLLLLLFALHLLQKPVLKLLKLLHHLEQ